MKIKNLPEDLKRLAKKRRKEQGDTGKTVFWAFDWDIAPEPARFWSLVNKGKFKKARKLIGMPKPKKKRLTTDKPSFEKRGYKIGEYATRCGRRTIPLSEVEKELKEQQATREAIRERDKKIAEGKAHTVETYVPLSELLAFLTEYDYNNHPPFFDHGKLIGSIRDKYANKTPVATLCEKG